MSGNPAVRLRPLAPAGAAPARRHPPPEPPRLRRVCGAMVLSGTLLSPLMVLLVPLLGGGAWAGVLAAWGLLLLPGGCGLLIALCVHRTAALARAFALSVVMLALQIASLAPARRIGAEVYYGSHLAELEELGEAIAREPTRPGKVPELLPAPRTRQAMRRLHLSAVTAGDGAWVFGLGGGSDDQLLSTGARGGGAHCRTSRAVPLGEHWYLVRCQRIRVAD